MGGQQGIMAVMVKSVSNILFPGYAAEAPKYHMITFKSTISWFSTSMEDERPFAMTHPRESSESTTIDMEDELRCLYASARYLTGYLKPQQEAASLKPTDRWHPGHADDNDKEQTDLLAQNIAVAYVPIKCHVGMCRSSAAENRPPTFTSPEFDMRIRSRMITIYPHDHHQ
ncbi:hypothetical protein P692DRAFT_20876520 [Suillus brevipes Sb2]|nr:hypothetical protein P692DRAFT_20876520 [Suillus brevipes Sb2]